jgi:S1-C subfamily serine protease
MSEIEPAQGQPVQGQPVQTETVQPEPMKGAGFFRRHRTAAIIGCAAAFALVIGGGGVALGAGLVAQQDASRAVITQQYNSQPANLPPRHSTHTTTPATAAQKAGLVTILTDLFYQSHEQAAGTGMILTASGEILTNNHGVAGSTTIQVTVGSTGKTYAANVVGTDAVDDIAVLQLVDSSGHDVSGLTTVSTDKAHTVATGDSITSIGNAKGTGHLVVAAGTVAGLDQPITVSNDLTGQPQSLTGLITLNSDVVPGDSGGPLLDSHGDVVGIVTAASSGGRNITGYAIPVATALSIVSTIESGTTTGNVLIGLPAFLGVTFASGGTTTTISGTVAGKAAEAAGLVVGDTITSVDGTAVSTRDQLSTLVKSYAAGTQVVITYTDSTGAAQSVTVSLGVGPAA